VRCAYLTSSLLILVLATSGSGCVMGCGAEVWQPLLRLNVQRGHVQNMPGGALIAASQCGDTVKRLRGHCTLRSVTQLQFAELRRLELVTPLWNAAGNIPFPFNSATIISSIGSPQTDRGPPRV
jgi:hypothetical protein